MGKFFFVELFYSFTTFVPSPLFEFKKDTGTIQEIFLCFGALKGNKSRLACRRTITKVFHHSDNFVCNVLTTIGVIAESLS